MKMGMTGMKVSLITIRISLTSDQQEIMLTAMGILHENHMKSHDGTSDQQAITLGGSLVRMEFSIV